MGLATIPGKGTDHLTKNDMTHRRLQMSQDRVKYTRVPLPKATLMPVPLMSAERRGAEETDGTVQESLGIASLHRISPVLSRRQPASSPLPCHTMLQGADADE